MSEIMSIDPGLKSHFLSLYAMALTDTQIDSKELEMLFNMGRERGIDKDEIQNLLLYPDRVKFTIPSDTIAKMEYLYDFARMAWANNELDEYEVHALRKFCIKFGFEPDKAKDITEFLLEEAQKGTQKVELLEIVKSNM